MSTSVVDRDDALAEYLPQLLRLAAALTGSVAGAERLTGQALARVRPQELGSAYPLLPLRQAVVRRFLLRSFRYPAADELGRLPRFDLVVVALTCVEHLTPAELATTVERPLAQVQNVLAATRAAMATAERDVAAELHERTELETDPAAVRRETDRARRQQRHTRVRATVLTLLAVTVVALAVLAPGAIRARWPVDPRPADRWAGYVSLDPVDGWTLTERVVTRTQESVTFTRTDAQSCTLVLADDDTVDAATTGEQAVRVNGHRGVLSGTSDAPTLRWAYAEDTAGRGVAADLSCGLASQVDANDLLALAAGVRFGVQPLLLPFRVDAGTDPFSPAWVTEETTAPGSVAVTSTATDPRWSYVTLRIIMDHLPGQVIGPTGDTRLDPGSTVTRINGRTAYVYQDRDDTGLPEICLTDRTGRVCLSAYWTSGDQTTRFQMTSDIGALMQRIAEHVQPADNLFDRSTWFAAPDVLG